MADINISDRLSQEKQTITIKEGITFEVDCSAEAMIKAEEKFKKGADLNTMFEIIELLLVEKDALKIIKEMKLKAKNIETIVLAIMAQIQEIPFEEMEKRFRENTAE
nr:MAG TPA: hypothetical protein [Caudoviricetes sp.]